MPVAKTLSLCAAAMLLTGCGGTNTVRMVTEPTGASVTVNGKLAGNAPQSIPQKHWGTGGESLSVKLELPGYEPLLRTIPHSELYNLWANGNYEAGSEFGPGNTFTIHCTLQKRR